MKKWIFDFDLADQPLLCETYYDRETDKRMILLESGEKLERPLVDMYDTEEECIEEKLKEIKLVRNLGRQEYEKRYGMVMFHKRRMQLKELGF